MGQFSLMRSQNCTPLYFWIPYTIRNVFKILRTVLNRIDLLGKDHAIHYVIFLGITIRVLCIVWVSSHSSRVGIIHHFFFWVPYSVRNVLKKFDIFSQLALPKTE